METLERRVKSATAFFDFVLAVFPDGERGQSPFFFTKIIDFISFLRNCIVLCASVCFFFEKSNTFIEAYSSSEFILLFYSREI